MDGGGERKGFALVIDSADEANGARDAGNSGCTFAFIFESEEDVREYLEDVRWVTGAGEVGALLGGAAAGVGMNALGISA